MTKPVKANGHLRQLRSATALTEAPWLGWGIIGLLLTMVAFFGVGWIKNIELQITEGQREIKTIQLAMQTEKARTDSIAIQVSTLTGVLDGIRTSLNSIDNRLIKMEVADGYRLKAK